jgi:molybdopterin converting factor small subunit
MRVRVLFFGRLKDLAGAASMGQGPWSIELPKNASLRDLLAIYQEKIPALKELIASLALAVNGRYADPDTKLNPDDEVALLPPVSGG